MQARNSTIMPTHIYTANAPAHNAGINAQVVYQHVHVPLCTYFEDRGHQMFIDGEDGDLQYGHDEELHRAGFTQNGPEGDQDCSCTEVSVDYSAGQRRKHVFRKTEIIGEGEEVEHKNPQTSTVQPPSSSYSAANRTSHWFTALLLSRRCIFNCINDNQGY